MVIHICVRGVNLTSVFTIYRLDFENEPTVRYFCSFDHEKSHYIKLSFFLFFLFFFSGQCGAKTAVESIAITRKASWKDANDLCNIQFDGKAKLITKSTPELFKNLLMHHRYILQQLGW